MAIYMNYTVGYTGAGSLPYTSAAAMVARVREIHPRGVDQMVIAESSRPFIRMVKTDRGIIAILIGLLLPAVQKLDSSSPSDLQVLKGALGVGGKIGFQLADGSVRPAPGSGSITPDVQFLFRA